MQKIAEKGAGSGFLVEAESVRLAKQRIQELEAEERRLRKKIEIIESDIFVLQNWLELFRYVVKEGEK